MKVKWLLLFFVFGLSSVSFLCNKATVKPGENRLTINLKSGNRELKAQAKVYLNEKFIGMTDLQGDLQINLVRGEYAICITLEGYEPWEETILMVGAGHKQYIYPNLKRISSGKRKP